MDAQCNLFAHTEANILFAPEVKRPLPVVVVTGFLGSGKTTLMGRLLENRANLRIAAVAHDLAKLNVDAEFLASEKSLRRADAASADGSVAALIGCACCPEFDTELKGMVKASLRDGIDEDNLDYLVLETSGAADPRRLVSVLEQRFGPCTRARLDRVIAVADADGLNQSAKLNGRDEETRLQHAQLACADVVVLNKIDLVDDAERADVHAELRKICPHANIVECSYGDVSIADLLEVSEAGGVEAAVSHEVAPVTWIVQQDLDAKPRLSAAIDVTSLPQLAGHTARHRTVEWSSYEKPVCIGKLQEFLALRLPAWQATLRRGKGLLWLAQDPTARWEWQVSGRLRYSSRRDDLGFGGAAPWSCLVLIFAANVPQTVLDAAYAALENLAWIPIPRSQLPDAVERQAQDVEEVVQALERGKPAFEILQPQLCQQSCESQLRGADVICFRLTGRAHFAIPPDVDLTEQPYSVDVDELNCTLARLVSIAQGGSFLAAGCGMDSKGQAVVGLLLPIQTLLDDELPPPPPGVIISLLEVARSEALPLLRKYFGHVQACRCGM